MKAVRWTSNDDHYFGPFTYAREKGARSFSVMLGTGYDEDVRCRLRVSAFDRTLILALPPIITPYRQKVVANSWDADTVARLGRNWYYESYQREYGCYLSDGAHFCIHFGQQTGDSSTDKSWGCFVPWLSWRFHREALYGIAGEKVWEAVERRGLTMFRESRAAKEACPAARFDFVDYDGEKLFATTVIEEREWRFGDKWCSWLSWFTKPKIKRSLSIEYSGEVGSEKGSWKGGTIGTGIEMLPGELHEAAFRRHCEKDRLTFVGRRFDVATAPA